MLKTSLRFAVILVVFLSLGYVTERFNLLPLWTHTRPLASLVKFKDPSWNPLPTNNSKDRAAEINGSIGIDIKKEELPQLQKLRDLKELLELPRQPGDQASLMIASHFTSLLNSEAPDSIKSAALQSLIPFSFSDAEARKIFQTLASLLSELGPRQPPPQNSADIQKNTHEYALNLLCSLNLQGVFDQEIVDLFDQSEQRELARCIHNEHLQKMVQNEIKSTEKSSEKSLGRSINRHITAQDEQSIRNDHLESPPDKGQDAKLLTGAEITQLALSQEPGKSQSIFAHWYQNYYQRIGAAPVTMRHKTAAHTLLANPTYELAHALWTESDSKVRGNVESRIIELFINDFSAHKHLTDREFALSNLAVSYIDLCLAKAVAPTCAESLNRDDSFAFYIGQEYLKRLIDHPQGPKTLGLAQEYLRQLPSQN